MSRLYFIPDHGWAEGAAHEPVLFDRQRRIPVNGMTAMARVANMASSTETPTDWRESLVHESSGGTALNRVLTVAALRLCCEFPSVTGMGLEQKYPGTLVELDAEPVEALWQVLRVMVKREDALREIGGSGPGRERRARETGGDLLANRDMAIRLATTMGDDACSLYEEIAGALSTLEGIDVMDAAPAVGPVSSSMPPIGTLRLTPEQAVAAGEILKNFRRVRQRCSQPERLPWRELELSDPQWHLLERQKLWPRIMSIAGAAGVGKSFTMLYLTLRIMQEDPTVENVCLTAYTHNAANVIEVYFDLLLNRLAEELPDLKIQEHDIQIDMGYARRKVAAWRLVINGIPRFIGRPRTLLSNYTTQNSEHEADFLESLGRNSGWDFGINDESSMVPRETMRAVVANAPHPILLTGDPAQLPPVGEIQGDNVPDAFNRIVAEGFAGRLGAFGDLMEATNLRTQGGRGGILRLAHEIRGHIKLPPHFKPKNLLSVDKYPLGQLEDLILNAAADEDFIGVSEASEKTAIAEYVEDYWDPDVEGRPARTSLIIAGTHQTRSRINNDVRKLLGFEGTKLVAGETLIVESARRFTVGDRDGGDISLANNEFVWVTEVIAPTLKVPVYLSDGTDDPDARAKRNQRLLVPTTPEDEDVQPKGEIRFDLPIEHVDCAHCVVCTATGEEAEVRIPHATLAQSPKVRKAWQDEYMSAYRLIKKHVVKLQKEAWGSVFKPGTFATIALWSRDRTLQIPLGDRAGKRIVKPFQEMGIHKNWKFDARLRMHYLFGQHRPYVPEHVVHSMDSHYGEREKRIVMEMIGWREAPLLFAHPGYCITGHASQGSQFSTVYATLEPPSIYRFKNSDKRAAEGQLQECLRWLYVVMTRAESSLVIIGSRLREFDRKPGAGRTNPADLHNPQGGTIVRSVKVSKEEADDLFS